MAALFAALVLTAGDVASAAEKMPLFNGEVKKGEISARLNGTIREVAIDEAISALGLIPTKSNSAIAAVIDGKKIEFWNASNVARSAGNIISLPVPVSNENGHWWGEANCVSQVFDTFFVAIGKPSSFSWGEAKFVNEETPPSAQKPQPAQKTETKQENKAETGEKTSAATTESEAQDTVAAEPSGATTAATVATAAAKTAPSSFGGSTSPIVVVDAGHGGHDPGASANGVIEKNVNLNAAITLAKILKEQGVDARLTRGTDVYLKLAERTRIANNHNADVFVSLHCNSLPKGRSNVSGIEYYIMALPSDKDAMNLAIVENREISSNAGVNKASDAQNADKKTQLLLKILGDMQQNDKINSSTALVEVMHKVAKADSMRMRKVAQAPFFVLRGAGMPAVLVEMGYLTNAAEAKNLNSAAYREKLCRSIAKGIVQYIRTHPTER